MNIDIEIQNNFKLVEERLNNIKEVLWYESGILLKCEIKKIYLKDHLVKVDMYVTHFSKVYDQNREGDFLICNKTEPRNTTIGAMRFKTCPYNNLHASVGCFILDIDVISKFLINKLSKQELLKFTFG